MLLTRLLLLLLTTLATLTTDAAAGERWYVFSIGDTPVGYSVEESDGTRTRNEVFARLTRLGKSVEMRFETTTVERADGELQRLDFETLLSKQPTRPRHQSARRAAAPLAHVRRRSLRRGSRRDRRPVAVVRPAHRHDVRPAAVSAGIVAAWIVVTRRKVARDLATVAAYELEA